MALQIPPVGKLPRAAAGLAFAALALAWLGGCVEPNPLFDPDLAQPQSEGCSSGQLITEPTSAFERPDQLDVLVVVSDAPGAEPVQQRLAAAIPRFLGLLEAQGTDWQLGFTSGDASSTNTAGALRAGTARPGCEEAPRILSSADGDRAGDWAACNALLGTEGSHIQKPMEAAVAALTTQNTRPLDSGGNAGFLRPRARLLVLFVTDRDDCSGEQGVVDASARRAATECAQQAQALTPPASFAQSLLGLKNSASSVSVAVLGGPDSGRAVGQGETLEPACQDAEGAAVYPTTRLIALADLLAPQNEFEPACASSFGVSIAHVAELATAPPLDLCAEARVTDPDVSATLVQGSDRTSLEVGAQGVLYMGPTEGCDNGVIRINPEVIQGADASLELRYCTR